MNNFVLTILCIKNKTQKVIILKPFLDDQIKVIKDSNKVSHGNEISKKIKYKVRRSLTK